MQKVFFKTAVLCICLSLSQIGLSQQINAEQIFEFKATLIFPPTAAGPRVIYSVTGGTVTGKINGKILPVGGDFATFPSPTIFKLDVRTVIQTDDSATIYCTYSGYFYTDEETWVKVKAGKGFELSNSQYYFRTNPMFETTSPKYDWLNHTVAVGYGTLTKEGVSYKIFAIK
jgi:Protein of unknown function (DUF3237)